MARRGSALAWLSDESGFTLVEMLAAMVVLIAVLGATLGLSDTTENQAAKDRERIEQVGSAQAGLAAMGRDLRQACVLLPVTSALDDRWCGTWFDTTKPGGVGSIASSCPSGSTAAACIDFIIRTRTSGGQQSYQRIKLDCTQPGESPGELSCRRYRSPTATALTAAITDPPSAYSIAVDGVVNTSGGTCRAGGSGTHFPVFSYYDRSGNAVADPAPGRAAGVQIDVCAARHWTRRARYGIANAVVLQDGVRFLNLDRDETSS